MGLGDLANQGKDALNSEHGEQISDQALEHGGDAADKVSGGKFGEQIDKGKEWADGQVGQSDRSGDEQR